MTVFNDSTIRYASVWEDADVLCAALEPVARQGNLLSIASGGDNALALLTLDPARVVACDLSGAQLACLELRRAAFARLEYPELLAFLGVTPSGARRFYYRALCLGNQTRAFWDERMRWIERGMIHAGKFERYLRFFGLRVLPLLYSAETRKALLREKSPEEQRRFYEQRWDKKAWRCLFLAFFSRQVLGLAGRDPALLRHVRVHVGRRLLARARHGLARVPTWDNPYLTYIMTGNYAPHALPRYLRPEHFEPIRGRLDRLEPFHGPIQATGRGPFDGFNLSDLFEYFSPQEHRQVYSELMAQARPAARLVYWNLLASRGAVPGLPVTRLQEEARALHRQDRAWFYQALQVDRRD